MHSIAQRSTFVVAVNCNPISNPVFDEAIRARRLIYPALLLIAAFAVYIFPASRAILDDGDALYAHIAQQMIVRGDWVTPYANGVRFLDKPPLMYWLMAVSYMIFGTSEMAARLPAALGVFGTAWLLWWLGSKAAGAKAGLIAGIAFIFSAGTLFFTLEAFPDIFLVFFLMLASAAFLHWHINQGKSAWATIAFFIALAGAALAKSLIGVVFPVAAVTLFLVFAKERPRPKLAHIMAGIAVFLALTSPWHILAAERNSGFLTHYFINEQALRFLGRRQPIDYGSIPIPIFWILLLVWLFPWSAFLPATWRLERRFAGKNEWATATIKLAWYWAGTIVVFFTLSSRLEHYSFPALPPLTLLIGIALATQIDDRDSKAAKTISRGFAGLALFGALMIPIAIATLIWLKTSGHGLLTDVAMSARERAYTNLFSPLFDLPVATRAQLIKPFFGALAAFAVGTIAAWYFNRHRQRSRSLLTLAVMMMVFSFLALYSLHLCEGLLSSKPFGLVLKRVAKEGEKVVIAGDFESANSINFYAPVELMLYKGSAASIEQGLGYQDAPRMILKSGELDILWRGQERIFLLASKNEIDELGLSPALTIFDYAGRVLITNRDDE